jgi:xylulokinase
MDWDQTVCRRLGVPVDLLPEVRVWPTDPAGRITADAAEETGLAEGTLVITGAADALGGSLSVGAVRPGDASLLYGTTMIVIRAFRTTETDYGPTARPGPIPGIYQKGLAMSSSGALTRWFRDNFGQIECEVEEKLGVDAYQLLGEQAAQIPPGSEGLIVLPYFAGERAPIYDPIARGLLLGLTLSHTRKHIYRALLEGVAYALRHNLDIIEGQGAKIERILATGGGSKSKLWTQIVSDVIGREQHVVVDPIGAPYGDAFMAGYGAGLFEDVSPFLEVWAPPTVKVVPRAEAKTMYDKLYAIYRGLYEANKVHMHQLAQLSTES